MTDEKRALLGGHEASCKHLANDGTCACYGYLAECDLVEPERCIDFEARLAWNTRAPILSAAQEVWKAIGQRPLFGHHSGKKMGTFWACFMKLEEMK